METISIGHGAGGRLTEELVSAILGKFPGQPVADREDCALLPGGLAVTIDGYTVTPPDFAGGNIGSLCICGSANDLAVRGAKPLYIALGIIAEEGFPISSLSRYMESAGDICEKLGIELVTGDTKVVPKGQADGLFLTTCAIGKTGSSSNLGTANISPGDSVILTSPPGMHGATIAADRYGLNVPGLSSDCAALWPMIEKILPIEGIRCMRDCTRGGLGTVLCEWAESAGVGIEIDETLIPWDEASLSVCDLLGLDPLHMAGEGCAALVVSGDKAEEALAAARDNPLGKRASLIGSVTEAHPGYVGIHTLSGGTRLVDKPVGEELPRIC
jgi:hydrogenase expression/formation protein HypE